MQIHELNNYTGSLNGSAFVAVDNGSDTGKVSVPQILETVNETIEEVNARVDNIIAGGDAPSEAEILDARHGATVLGGFNYKSLGNAIRGQATDLFNMIDQVENLMFDITKGTNRFNASLVTNDTIYAGKQLTGSGTLIDNANVNVSPYLAIEPGVTYTMGLVPAYGIANTPWYTLQTAIAFYDEDYTFVSRVDSTGSPVTFTTPTNAKYYRFNIYNSIGITLNLLAKYCMLVYGSSLPGSFTAFSDSMKLKEIAPIYYSIANDIITVTSDYGDSYIEVEFGKRGPNNLPDFRYITTAGRVKYNNSSDWFSPFVLEALSNIDGDDPNRVTYTGGNHNYNDTGSMDYSATARNISLKYYADGKEIGNGDAGSCSILSIVWTNRVQAYNTRKADGTGREVLEERHTLVFNGAEWETYLEIEALEDIFCKQYYGLQCAIGNYGTIYMIGANYRKPFVYTDPHDSGNYNPNIYVAYDQDDRLEMEVDRSVDLGSGSMYGSSGTQGFRTSGRKGYTYFVTQKNLAANDVYSARGWYRFIPQF